MRYFSNYLNMGLIQPKIPDLLDISDNGFKKGFKYIESVKWVIYLHYGLVSVSFHFILMSIRLLMCSYTDRCGLKIWKFFFFAIYHYIKNYGLNEHEIQQKSKKYFSMEIQEDVWSFSIYELALCCVMEKSINITLYGQALVICLFIFFPEQYIPLWNIS